jgi:hypothetical protein
MIELSHFQHIQLRGHTFFVDRSGGDVIRVKTRSVPGVVGTLRVSRSRRRVQLLPDGLFYHLARRCDLDDFGCDLVAEIATRGAP